MRQPDEPSLDDGPESHRVSKSERKRAAGALQDLGVELSALSDEEIGELELPEPLVTALCTLKRLSSHGAQVRQQPDPVPLDVIEHLVDRGSEGSLFPDVLNRGRELFAPGAPHAVGTAMSHPATKRNRRRFAGPDFYSATPTGGVHRYSR